MVKIIPFQIETDYDADLILKFIVRGTKIKKFPYYNIRIGYNPAEEVFIPEKSSCECWAFLRGRKENEKYICKHIKSSSKCAKNFKEELQNGIN